MRCHRLTAPLHQSRAISASYSAIDISTQLLHLNSLEQPFELPLRASLLGGRTEKDVYDTVCCRTW